MNLCQPYTSASQLLLSLGAMLLIACSTMACSHNAVVTYRPTAPVSSRTASAAAEVASDADASQRAPHAAEAPIHQVKGEIIGSTPDAIHMRLDDMTVGTVAREEILDIDHPGETISAIGIATTMVLGTLVIASATEYQKTMDSDSDAFLKGLQPFATGTLSLGVVLISAGPLLWGLDAWGTSLNKSQERRYGLGLSNDVEHDWSGTLSVLPLTNGAMESNLEYRLADRMGLSLTLGAGEQSYTYYKDYSWSGDKPKDFMTLTGGAALRFYPVGSFIHGMQIGVGPTFTYIDAPEAERMAPEFNARRAGLRYEAFLGYKYTTNAGLTLESQVVIDLNTASNFVLINSGTPWPQVRLNAGWSF